MSGMTGAPWENLNVIGGYRGDKGDRDDKGDKDDKSDNADR